MPPGYESTGDPVEGNPYPDRHPLHKLWARVTREAEEKSARLKSQWLRLQDAEFSHTPDSIEAMEDYNRRFWAGRRQIVCSEFEIWAARGAQVIFTDKDVRAMDQWLVGYADAFLELNAQHMQKCGLPVHLAEQRLRELRTDLAAVVLHWKAEVRHVCGLRQADYDAQRKSTQAEDNASPKDPIVGKKFSRRAEWLREALETRKWTVQEFELKGGPNAKTTRKVLKGEEVRETVLERIAHGLSMNGRVRVSDIPEN